MLYISPRNILLAVLVVLVAVIARIEYAEYREKELHKAQNEVLFRERTPAERARW